MSAKNTVLFFLVVFISNIVQCVTGFAGTVLAMPPALALAGYDVAKPTLNLLGIAASVGVILSAPRAVNVKEGRKTLIFLLLGVLAGEIALSFGEINGEGLYPLLGGAVLAFTALGIANDLTRDKHALPALLPKGGGEERAEAISNGLLLVVAGAVHGLFVCGGPLLVVYAERKFHEKEEFRATLSAIWVVLNALIALSDFLNGRGGAGVLEALFPSMIALFAAVLIGNLIAKKMPKNVFMGITYLLMVIGGASLLFK